MTNKVARTRIRLMGKLAREKMRIIREEYSKPDLVAYDLYEAIAMLCELIVVLSSEGEDQDGKS